MLSRFQGRSLNGLWYIIVRRGLLSDCWALQVNRQEISPTTADVCLSGGAGTKTVLGPYDQEPGRAHGRTSPQAIGGRWPTKIGPQRKQETDFRSVVWLCVRPFPCGVVCAFEYLIVFLNVVRVRFCCCCCCCVSEGRHVFSCLTLAQTHLYYDGEHSSSGINAFSCVGKFCA